MKHSRTSLVALSAAMFALPSLLPSHAHGSPGGAVSERGLLEAPLAVPAAVMTAIGKLLPESALIAPNLVSSVFDPNLVVSAPANIKVSFIHEGAGFRNSLGYFTYRIDDTGKLTIIDRQLVFPNASYGDSSKGWGGGTLVSGDSVTLRDAAGAVRAFAAGDRIGFFLVSDGWNGTGVRGWDPIAPTIPSTKAALNSVSGVNVYTSIDGLNPENANGRADVSRHFAAINMTGITGFLGNKPFCLVGVEDQRRDGASDNDFNDLVFIAQGNPITAVGFASAPTYNPVDLDPDHDGVKGIDDAFPNDPTKAFIVRTPASGWQTVVFEDTYPGFGDADYNDAVVQFAWERVLNAAGQVVELEGTYHLIARGASLDHTFGVALRGLPSGISGTFSIERFGSDGSETQDAPHALLPIADGGGATKALRFEVFPSTRDALPRTSHSTTNTEELTPTTPPASARVVVRFAAPVAASALGAPPFDPYLTVHPADVTIHLVGTRPFDDDAITVIEGATPYLNQKGQPWAMMVPYDFRYPLERVEITRAYPAFATWRSSHGTAATTWYQTPGVASLAIAKLSDAVRARPWTLAVVP